MRTHFIHSVPRFLGCLYLASAMAMAADKFGVSFRRAALSSGAAAIFSDLALPTNNTPLAAPIGVSRNVEMGTNLVRWASLHRMELLDDKQKLGVGDRITFRVLEDQEEPKALTVSDAGELDVPELGLVKAVGKGCKELAYEIQARLEQTTYYQATVILGIDLLNKTMSGRRVYVAGYVQRPGPQEIPGGETWTVSKAIMRTGGFTEYADKKRVRVVRAGGKGAPGKSFTVNVNEIWVKGRTDLDMAVEPEDLIYVPPRAVNF